MTKFHETGFDEKSLIDALREAETPSDVESDPGMTTKEIVKALGVGYESVSNQLIGGLNDGSLLSGRRVTKNRIGNRCIVPVYRPAAIQNTGRKPKVKKR